MSEQDSGKGSPPVSAQDLPPPTRAMIAALLPEQDLGQDLGAGDYRLEVCRGGWNNRVWKLSLAGSEWLLKQYFSSAQDPRPRLQHEYGFLRFAAAAGVKRLPRAYGCLPAEGLALYEWIEGEPYNQPGPADVAAALAFITELQAHRDQARDIPKASEFCADLGAHLAHLERRLERLAPVAGSEAGAQFQRLLAAAAQLRALTAASLAARPELAEPLSPEQLCLSPSDFGFHNALRTPQGPVFLDFEYAGWDDPAQLVCDFCAQFEVPVPPASYAGFAAGVAALDPRPDWQLARMRLLLPVHRLKWVCIALNHFAPAAAARRRFAGGDEAARQRQLHKVDHLLHVFEKELSSWPITIF